MVGSAFGVLLPPQSPTRHGSINRGTDKYYWSTNGLAASFHFLASLFGAKKALLNPLLIINDTAAGISFVRRTLTQFTSWAEKVSAIVASSQVERVSVRPAVKTGHRPRSSSDARSTEPCITYKHPFVILEENRVLRNAMSFENRLVSKFTSPRP